MIRTARTAVAVAALIACNKPTPPLHGGGGDLPTYDTGPCREPGDTASPLVVDLDPTERGDFEVALDDDGIKAVRLTCKEGLVLLTACKAPGAYGFKGATLKEKVVQFESADELKANLPLGVSFAKVSGELSRGAALDVALAMVGKLRASKPLVGVADLEGDCKGATHFIRGATVGAFAMKQGVRGKVKAAATIFVEVSKEGTTSTSVAQRDGTIDACKKGGARSTEAPDDCGAILRLELRALVPGKADPAAQAAPSIEVEGCPDGMIFDAARGKCRTAQPGEGKQCKWGDEKDCRDQCHAGHVGSCAYHAGALLERDKLADAVPYLEKGCAAGIPTACHNLAFALWSGAGVAKDDARAMQLFTQVCDGGTAVGCAGVALLHHEGSGVPKDPAKAAELYQLACNGGDQEFGCPLLGRLYQNGEGVPKDVEKARGLYQAACNAGSRNGCLLLKQM